MEAMALQEITDHLDATVAGLDQHGERIGAADAPVTLTFWADLQCPSSKAFAFTALRDLLAEEVRAGTLAVRFRPLATTTEDPDVFVLQHAAAAAAGAQDRLWDYVQVFLLTQREENSGYVTPRHLALVAQQVDGLDLHRWAQDMAGDHQAGLIAATQDARAAGVTGTPGLALSAGGVTVGPVIPHLASIRAEIADLIDSDDDAAPAADEDTHERGGTA